MGLVRRLGRKVVSRLTERSPSPRVPETHHRSTAEPVHRDEPEVDRGGPPCVLADADALKDAISGPGGLRLVNHWATWCDGCVEELPLLLELHERIGDRVEFIGVSWDGFQGSLSGEDLLEEVRSVSVEHGLLWESLVVDMEPEGFFSALDLSCQTIPQVWLVNESGSVFFRLETVMNRAAMERLMGALTADR